MWCINNSYSVKIVTESYSFEAAIFSVRKFEGKYFFEQIVFYLIIEEKLSCKRVSIM